MSPAEQDVLVKIAELAKELNKRGALGNPEKTWTGEISPTVRLREALVDLEIVRAR